MSGMMWQWNGKEDLLHSLNVGLSYFRGKYNCDPLEIRLHSKHGIEIVDNVKCIADDFIGGKCAWFLLKEE